MKETHKGTSPGVAPRSSSLPAPLCCSHWSHPISFDAALLELISRPWVLQRVMKVWMLSASTLRCPRLSARWSCCIWSDPSGSKFSGDYHFPQAGVSSCFLLSEYSLSVIRYLKDFQSPQWYSEWLDDSLHRIRGLLSAFFLNHLKNTKSHAVGLFFHKSFVDQNKSGHGLWGKAPKCYSICTDPILVLFR